MEDDGKSLKEDSSFEILPFIDDSTDFSQDIESNIPGTSESISIELIKSVLITPPRRFIDDSDSVYDFCEIEPQNMTGSTINTSEKQDLDRADSVNEFCEMEPQIMTDSTLITVEKQDLDKADSANEFCEILPQMMTGSTLIISEKQDLKADSVNEFCEIVPQIMTDSSFISAIKQVDKADYINTFCKIAPQIMTDSSLITSIKQNLVDKADSVNEYSDMKRQTKTAVGSYLPSTTITLEHEFELEPKDVSEVNGKLESKQNMDHAVVKLQYSFDNLKPYNRPAQNVITTDVIPFKTQLKVEPSKELKTMIYSVDVETVVPVHSMSTSTRDGVHITYQRFLPHKVNKDFKNGSLSRTSTINPILLSEFHGIVKEDERKGDSVQMYCRRSSKGICQAINQSLKFCKWIRTNNLIRRLMERAKVSLSCFVNAFELEMNQIMGEEPLKLTVLADELYSTVIEEAFCEIFSSQIKTSALNLQWNCGPKLPVGLISGLRTAETKIQYARRYSFTHENSVIVSVSPLLYKTVEQRWQMTTAICLDDPKLNLSLHNFTLSIPVPNEYVMEAKRRTPETYSFQELGFSVNIEQAIDYLTGMKLKDTQEFLTGFNSHSSLKSAARILAGMYQKYVTGYT